MAGERLIVVEDDPDLARTLTLALERDGFQVTAFQTGRQGLEGILESPPDLVLLDLNLPDLDGLSLCRELRGTPAVQDLPLIILTARVEESDRVLGLDLGADDYVTKPFDFDVLAARVKAVLRRAQKSGAISIEPAPLTVGDLSIDPLAHSVVLGGHPIDLPPREFDLLYTLALEAGHVISTSDLIARVWGAEYDGEPQVVYVHIRWLRENLEHDPNQPRRIITIRGVGYKLEPQAA